MSYRKRLTLADAIAALTAEAKTCPHCGVRFVYGRRGAMFCSHECARNAAQRAYRARSAQAARADRRRAPKRVGDVPVENIDAALAWRAERPPR